MQTHFGNYSPHAFGWGSRDPEHDSSLLVPFSHSGVSFGSMNRDVVGLFTLLLDHLVPQIDGGLRKGECGCYNPKSVTVGGDRSFHTYGIAIDINWTQNPMGVPHKPTGKYTLPSTTGKIARPFGCEWGGDWTNPKDWMHIEVHLSPADARAFSTKDRQMTEDETEAMIVQALRAFSEGTDHGRFTNEKYPYLVPGKGKTIERHKTR